MFEKEAEKYISNLDECRTKDLMRDSFKDGAEFGYNKANEWYYPAKGEYPKECENVLCYCKVVNVEFYSIGNIIIGGDNKIRWWTSNRREEQNVYAWKELVPPKGIKENERSNL